MPFFRVPAAFPQAKLLATTNFVGDAVAKIAGEDFELETMMQAGVDPHLYKPTAGDLRRILQAEMIFYVGLTLEAKFSELLGNMEGKAFAITASIPNDALLFFNDQRAIPDPHVWFDPLLWKLAFQRIADVLSERFPEKRDLFQKRASRAVARSEELHRWIERRVAELPEPSRILVTAHDAFAYFAKRYGFRLHGLQGINTQAEMSIARLNRIAELVERHGVKAVFVENTVSPKTVEALVKSLQAKNHPVRIGGELLSDTLGDPETPRGEYFGALRHNVETIVSALE